MPRTARELSPDMKSVKSISFRKSTDGSAIVATNTYVEHNGRPLILTKDTLASMMSMLEPMPASSWVQTSQQ